MSATIPAATAFAEGESVFPESYCAKAGPVTDQAALAAVAEVMPQHVSQVEGKLVGSSVLRALPKDMAVAAMAEAVNRSQGIAQFLSDPEFRSECAYYIGPDAIQALDAGFELDLAAPLSGHDGDGRPFAMKTMVLGRGQLGIVYNRERVTYHNRRFNRNISIRKTVTLWVAVSSDGRVRVLGGINGLSVDTGFPYGWEDIEAMRQVDRTVQTYVLGKWRSSTPVVPITRRGAPKYWYVEGASGSAPPLSRPISADIPSLEGLRRLSEARLPFQGY